MSGVEKLRARLDRLSAEPVAIPAMRQASEEPALFGLKAFRTGSKIGEGVTAFAAYARLEWSRQLSPALADSLEGDRDALLKWYVTEFAPSMRPGRAPLSTCDIAYLLAPDPLAANAAGLPRIVVWSLLCEPGSTSLLPSTVTAEHAFWWACERAPKLFVEDCLVPEAYVDRLTAPDIAGAGMSILESLLAGRFSEYASLLAMPMPRAAVEALLAVLAIEYPGLLRFAAPAALEVDFYRPLLEAAGIRHGHAAANLADRFRRACLDSGFDPQSRCYVSRDAKGNRSLPSVEPVSPGIARIRADIEIVGPLHLRSGLSQAMRRSIEVFEWAGLRVKATDFSLGFPSPVDAGDARPALSHSIAGATLFHLNPDMLPRAFAFGPGGYAKRRAGFFFWELDVPASCDFLAFELVDAIWTATRFVQRVYASSFQERVECVGLAMPAPVSPDRARARAELLKRVGLEASGFVAISVFDGLSYAARKNPDGAIRAFQAAFPGRADAALVLKVHNRPPTGISEGQGRSWLSIEEAAAADPRIKILNETTTYEDVLQLIAGADLFVSLHRSEGFGLAVAEAMQVGTPVLVTAYGGTEDFCTDATAFRMPFVPVTVANDDYAHVEPGRSWAEPDIAAAANAIRAAAENPILARAKADAAFVQMAKAHSYQAVAPRYVAALERLLATP